MWPTATSIWTFRSSRCQIHKKCDVWEGRAGPLIDRINRLCEFYTYLLYIKEVEHGRDLLSQRIPDIKYEMKSNLRNEGVLRGSES